MCPIVYLSLVRYYNYSFENAIIRYLLANKNHKKKEK